MLGVGYEAWVGFVPNLHAGDEGDVGNCVVPVCDYYSVVAR